MRAVFLVVTLDGRFIGRAPVDRDRLRHAVAANRLRQKPLGGLLVSVLGEEKVDRLARFIDGAIEIAPLALDFDVRLIHPPTHPHRALTPVKCLFEQRAILDGPPVDGGVIDVNAPFCHEFLNVACAQRIRHIPAHPHENDLFGEVGSLKTDRHRLSPSGITVGHRGRAYRKSPQMKICDKTIVLPQGMAKFRQTLLSTLEAEQTKLTSLGQELFHRLFAELGSLEAELASYQEKLEALADTHPVCQRLLTVPGIGPLTATALMAAVRDAQVFKNGRQFAAWLGLVPKPYSTGGQTRL